MFIVDFMPLLSRLPMKFQWTPYCVWHLYCRLLKRYERERRSACETLCFDSLSSTTKVYSLPERYWACVENKKNLWRLIRTFFIIVSKENGISSFVAFDGEINNSLKLQKENSVIQQDLTWTTEEADMSVKLQRKN